ncbi:hypothetical protein C8R43DRAFT_1051068 [Mycena crocata]|nr:hypothetical protein C8R43DRAFT_1051068 [Mycena crocata]
MDIEAIRAALEVHKRKYGIRDLPAIFRMSPEERRNIKKVDIYCDPVDEDNPLMVMAAFLIFAGYSTEFNVILSPRPWDPEAKLYGEDYAEIYKEAGFESHSFMVLPTGMHASLAWIKQLPERLQEYFILDRGFEHPYIRELALPYLVGSCYRFLLKFKAIGMNLESVRFFWDKNSPYELVVGLHHAGHVQDWGYAFTSGQRAKLAEYMQIKDPKKRGCMLVELVKESNQQKFDDFRREHPELMLTHVEAILRPFQDLLDERTTEDTPSEAVALAGGPFETILKYLLAQHKNGQSLSYVVILAQTLYTRGDRNIFRNQYNNHCAMPAAEAFFKLVVERRIPLLVTPTEVAKGGPFQMEEPELKWVYEHCPEFYETYLEFVKQTKTLVKLIAFDLIAILPLIFPDLMPARPIEVVKYSPITELQGRIDILKAVEKTSGTTDPHEGCVWSFYDDEEWQQLTKIVFMSLFKWIHRHDAARHHIVEGYPIPDFWNIEILNMPNTVNVLPPRR